MILFANESGWMNICREKGDLMGFQGLTEIYLCLWLQTDYDWIEAYGISAQDYAEQMKGGKRK